MRRSSRWTDRVRYRLADDAGSAALEFIVAGLVLLVPLVYLVVAHLLANAAMDGGPAGELPGMLGVLADPGVQPGHLLRRDLTVEVGVDQLFGGHSPSSLARRLLTQSARADR